MNGGKTITMAAMIPMAIQNVIRCRFMVNSPALDAC
jgi:hypothetical protein